MKDTFCKRLEIGANVSIIFVALLAGIVLLSSLLPHSSTNATLAHWDPLLQTDAAPKALTSPLAVGNYVSLPGVHLPSDAKSLLLVLSTQCHFCSESGPFYRSISKIAAKRGGLRLIAAFPQEVTDGQRYLHDMGIRVDEVVQARLSTIGVSGTPTLILIDNKGKVQRFWLGRLPPEMEATVLDALQQ